MEEEKTSEKFFLEARKGAGMAWNTKIGESLEFFKGREEEHLWMMVGKAEVFFWRAVLTDDENHYKDAIGMFDPIFEKCSDYIIGYKRRYARKKVSDAMNIVGNIVIKDYSESVKLSEKDVIDKLRHLEAFIAMAQVYLGSSLLHFKQMSYIKAPYHFRKGWKWFERSHFLIQELDSAGYGDRIHSELRGDVSFGMGLYHFVLSLVPPAFQWFLSFMGFKADRTHCFLELKSGWESGCLRSLNSALMLMWLNFLILEDEDEAQSILDKLSIEYPTSALVQITEGYFQFKRGALAVALEKYDQVFENAKEAKMTQWTALYFKGEVYWHQCDWEKVSSITSDFLNEAIGKTKYFVAYGSFRLSFSNWMLGKRDEDQVGKILARIPSLAKKNYEHDDFAIRMSKKFQENSKFTPFDEYFVSVECLLGGMQFVEAMPMLEKMYATIMSAKKGEIEFGFGETAELCELWYFFYLGRALLGQGKDSEAIELLEEHVLQKAHLTKGKVELQIIPHALVEIGESLCRNNQTKEGIKRFQEAKKYNNYEFQKYLHYRISRKLEALKQGH